MSVKTRKNTEKQDDLLSKLDKYFEKHSGIFFKTGMLAALIISVLLFSINMSEMGDDSGYVMRADNLLRNGVFPTFQGPFYPMVLAVFIAIFGVNIIVLKLLSLVFMMLSLFFFWKGFKGKIAYSLLVPSFLLLCINSYILYFSSQTFSEALYFLLQSVLFVIVSKHYTENKGDFSIKNDYKSMLLLGFVLFLGALTRNVHYGALITLIVVFLIWKKWKSAIAVTFSFGIFYSLFEVLKRVFWSADLAQLSAQGKQLMYKDPYNAHAGMEDFSGFVTRFIENSQTYISRCLYFITGLKSEDTDVSSFLTIFTYIILFASLILVFRKNKTLQLILFYIGALCSVTFIVLQSFWGQWRLIAVFYPYILIAVLAFFYYSLKKLKSLQFVFPVVISILFLAGISDTFAKAGKNMPVLVKNLSGDIFAGYSPDWKNFMLMSQWAAENTPEEFKTASRKPEMSFIYTGRPFYGIYSVKEVTPDDLKAKISTDEKAYGFDVERIMRVKEYESICNNLTGIVQTGDNSLIAIFKFKNDSLQKIENIISQSGISVDRDPFTTVFAKKAGGVQLSCIDPDLLVKLLKDNKSRYMILPSIRMNPEQNTGQILTTMHRFLGWIQLKYPRSIRLVHTIGDSEKSQLVEFDLDNMN